jgi:colanic acid biosynthesis glycosyl transferase WcaI
MDDDDDGERRRFDLGRRREQGAHMSRKARKPHILVFNQYYWPGIEATANLLTDLTRELAKDFDITVITGSLYGVDASPGRFNHHGVDVVRVRSSSFDRASLALRGLNYVTYMSQALAKGVFHRRRPDVVFCMTDPPMLADVGLVVARRFHAPLVVVSQDVFPEIAIELGRLENKALVSLLRFLVEFYLRRADRVVAIGDMMRGRLMQKGTPDNRITVIPNWVDTKAIVPKERDNEWAREHGVNGRFVVMHSGNIGHAQDLSTLIRAATFLRDIDRLALMIIGSGARMVELMNLSERLEVDSVTFLPYQPREQLSLSLSSADLHVVGLASGLAGYIVPSRLYGILAAGRPVVVAADRNSETAQLVESVGCGIVVPPGQPTSLASVIREAYEGQLPLAEMAQKAREFAVAETDRMVAIGRYRALLNAVVDAR